MLIGQEYLKKIYNSFEALFKQYERDPQRYSGARDLEYIKERLSGNVVIMDGLRYDLWLLLRDILIEEGWRIKEETFRIETPSITCRFLELTGITEPQGEVNGKTYSILKMAERDIGKRNLRKFLKEGYDLKFLHFNFIDTRVHGSTLDLYPLYEIIKREFREGIIPVLKELGTFSIISDHGFVDTKEIKERYRHGGRSPWEVVLPFADVR